MASASSSFVGTEGPPLSEGGVWGTLSAYWQSMRKANGAGVNSSLLGNDCAARYIGVTFIADQFSQITLASVPTGGQLYFHYVMVRMNTTAGCYLLTTAADVANNIIQLYSISNAGGYTQIGTNITTPANFAANDVMRLEAIGTTLNVVWNGSILRTTTNTTFASGQPAIGGWAQNGVSDVLFIKDWSAADIVAGTSLPPILPRTPSYRFSI